MLTSIAGGINAAPGDVLDLEPRVATAWIAAGIAVPAEADAPEAAVVEPPEKATKPRARPRKGA